MSPRAGVDARVKIKRIGTYLDVDESGFLRGVARDADLSEPWAYAVSALVQRYLDAWEEHVHSVYVRGSVASELAVEGLSDLDSLAVLCPEPRA